MKKILFLVFLVFVLFSCDNGKNLENNDKKTIYTSFYPIYFLTQSLVGEEANIVNLVPTGGEPHDFEPTLRQISDMRNADLIVLNGLGIESYEEKLIENIGSGKIFLLSENLSDLIIFDEDHKDEEHDHGNTDPHTWLSPKNYILMAEVLAQELEKRGFTTNKNIIENLKILDNDYKKFLENCSQKEIVTSHEAFGYLARNYGFSQRAILGISPEEEPSAKDIAGVIDLIKNNNLKYIFTEEFVSPKFSNTIKNETGVEVLTLHPLETLSPEDEENGNTYITIMQKNLLALTTGLECK